MATRYHMGNVPLSLAVFLATDSYDHNPDPNTISATSLIKPIRQLILSARVPQENVVIDLAAMMASRLGTAIHDAIERAWKTNYKVALRSVGARDKAIDKIRINPTKEELFDGVIAVYMEQRISKVVGNYTVSGKFDFIFDGILEDFKSTGTYAAMSGDNVPKYILQGSIYRYLAPDIITNDQMKIQQIFTDWSSMSARQNPAYPQARYRELVLPLMPISETEVYIKQRLNQIDELWNVDQSLLPLCTDEELWRTEPVYKYYKNGSKGAKKSTKNFDSELEANTYRISIGQGEVVTKLGGVSACKFCAAFSICTQKDDLIRSGDLVL